MALGSKEILQGRPGEERIKLSEAEKTYKIKIPEHLIDKFGPVLVTKKQVEKIKNGEITAKELSRIEREQLKGYIEQGNTNVEKVGSDIEKSNIIEKQGDNEKIQSGQEADETFFRDIENLGKRNPKVQNAIDTTKNISKKSVEKVKDFGLAEMVEKWKNSDNFLLKLLGILLGGLGLGKKEKLPPVDIQKTKKNVSEKIKTDILSKFGKIHPLLKKKLEEKIEDPDLISEEKILELKEISDKNGKLEIRDIKYILGEEEYKEIGESIKNDPETWKAIKLKYEAQIVNSISKEYGINLQGDKRAELNKLIQEKGAAEKIDILQFYTRVENGETITLGELTVGLFDEAAEATWFTMSLLGRGIVTADKFIFNIIEGGTKLMFGLAGFGLKHSLDLKDFKGSLEKMDEKERILILGLLYRKGGILFELLGSISSTVATYTIESLSSTSVTKWQLLQASKSSNINKKINTFRKVEKMLGGEGGMDVLNGALQNQKLINKNNGIIRVLNNVDKMEGVYESKKISVLKRELKLNGLLTKEIADDIKPLKTIREIRSILSKRVITNKFTIGEKFKGFFWKDFKARQIDFYRNIDGITAYQSKVIAGESKIIRFASGKTGEVLHSLQIGKNAERVLLEAKAGKIGAKTVKGVITKLEALKKLSLEAPDLCRAIFRGLPEIAVMGLAAGTRGENESIMEAMIKVAPFLTRIIGPGMMIFSLGGAYKDGKVEWVNVAEAGLGTIFLGLDAAAAVKIFGEHGLSGKSALEVGKFIVKPLTAPLDVAVKGVNFGRSAVQLARAKGSSKEVLKEILKKTGGKIKNIRAKKAAILLGVAIGGGYLLKEIFDEDFDDKYEELVNEGIINPKTGEIEDFKKAKEAFQSFEKEEKEAFVEVIFMTEKSALIDPSYLNFDIKENNLLVTAKENEAIGDWVITSDIEVVLKELGIKNIDFQNNTPKKQ